MKNVTEGYVQKEEGRKIKPVELYHFWRKTTHQYYTSGDVTVMYSGVPYSPATIKRSSVQYDSQLEVSKMTIQAAYIESVFVQYIAINPINIYWISVMRFHRDQNPLEADVVFLGQVKTVAFKGIMIEAACVGFEHFLKMPIPMWRYQQPCNHRLFSSEYPNGCGLIKALYRVPAIITMDATGTILTSDAFSDYDDGYFVWGNVEFEGEERGIVAHAGDTITMAFKMINLESGDTVDAYPGCDGRIETCRDKFINTNILNFMGFPFTPEENPALRTP